MKQRLVGNTLSLGVVQVANYIAPLVIILHLANTLGLEIYGILAFAQGIVAFFLIIIDFGFDLSATNKISKFRFNKSYIERLMGGILIIRLLLLMICSLVLVTYALLNSKYAQHSNIFILSLFPLAMQSFVPVWFFHGTERMKYFAMASIVAKIIFALTAVVFIKNPTDYFLVPILNGLGQLVTLIASIFFIHKLGYLIQKPNIKLIFYCFKFTKQFFVSRVAVASYMNGAIVVLGVIAQPAIIATYSMAEQLYKVMQSLLSPVASASYPYMSKEKDASLMLKLLFGVIALAFVGAFVGYYLSPFLLKLFFDESWSIILPVLNIFFIAIVIHAGAVMTGYPLAALVDKIHVANASVITGSCVYFASLWFLFFLKDITPANLAIIMLISELFVFLHRSLVLIPIAIKKFK